MKRLLDVAVVLSTACALTVTGLLVKREFFPSAPPGRDGRPTNVSDWKEYAASGRRVGPEDARVTIVEFSDFQCPYCEKVAGSLRAVRAKYPNDVAFVYRHFPLEAIHPHARTAALASECAAAQGRFEAYHDALYARQDSIGKLDWGTIGEAAGVPDAAGFQRCLSGKEFEGRVREDVAAGGRLGIESTPSLIIDGKLYRGAVPESELLAIVADAGARR